MISDLEPIKQLSNLTFVSFRNSKVKNIEPLKNLINLNDIYLDRCQIHDLNPLNQLKNLKKIGLDKCENITEEQVKNLQKALPNLEIYR